MTTPKELADKAKQQANAFALAYASRLARPGQSSFDADRASLHTTINQLQAMAEARQGSGEPVENVAEDVYDQLADMIGPHVTDTANGLPGSVVGAFAVLLDHWKLTRSDTAPPSAQQATGSGQGLADALAAATQAQPEGEPVGLLQGGLSNDELTAAWKSKLPGVEPTERHLSAFAVGIEFGFARARELEKADWSRVHCALKDAGVHPGRTDDHIADVIARALATQAQPETSGPLTNVAELSVDQFAARITGEQR